MVSKNNKKQLQEKEANRDVRYGIKKLAFGAASVAVAAGLVFAGNNVVDAQTGGEGAGSEEIVEKTVEEQIAELEDKLKNAATDEEKAEIQAQIAQLEGKQNPSTSNSGDAGTGSEDLSQNEEPNTPLQADAYPTGSDYLNNVSEGNTLKRTEKGKEERDSNNKRQYVEGGQRIYNGMTEEEKKAAKPELESVVISDTRWAESREIAAVEAETNATTAEETAEKDKAEYEKTKAANEEAQADAKLYQDSFKANYKAYLNEDGSVPTKEVTPEGSTKGEAETVVDYETVAKEYYREQVGRPGAKYYEDNKEALDKEYEALSDAEKQTYVDKAQDGKAAQAYATEKYAKENNYAGQRLAFINNFKQALAEANAKKTAAETAQAEFEKAAEAYLGKEASEGQDAVKGSKEKAVDARNKANQARYSADVAKRNAEVSAAYLAYVKGEANFPTTADIKTNPVKADKVEVKEEVKTDVSGEQKEVKLLDRKEDKAYQTGSADLNRALRNNDVKPDMTEEEKSAALKNVKRAAAKDKTAVETAQEKVNNSNTAVDNAQTAVNDAKQELDKTKTANEEAEAKAAADNKKAKETAQTNLNNAKDAQTAANKALEAAQAKFMENKYAKAYTNTEVKEYKDKDGKVIRTVQPGEFDERAYYLKTVVEPATKLYNEEAKKAQNDETYTNKYDAEFENLSKEEQNEYGNAKTYSIKKYQANINYNGRKEAAKDQVNVAKRDILDPTLDKVEKAKKDVEKYQAELDNLVEKVAETTDTTKLEQKVERLKGELEEAQKTQANNEKALEVAQNNAAVSQGYVDFLEGKADSDNAFYGEVVSEDISTTSETIPFETEEREIVDLPTGERRVIQEGVEGVKTITTTTPTLNGKPSGEPKVVVDITTPPVNKIVEVGTGETGETGVKPSTTKTPVSTSKPAGSSTTTSTPSDKTTTYKAVDSFNEGQEGKEVTAKFLDGKPENIASMEVSKVKDTDTNREYDITFKDKDGNVVKTTGRVLVTMPTDGKPVEYVYHMVDGVAERVEYAEEFDHVKFEADDFSVYGIKFAQAATPQASSTTTTSTETKTDAKATTKSETAKAQDAKAKESKDSKGKLPETGESFLLFNAAATSILAGLGLVTRRKED